MTLGNCNFSHSSPSGYQCHTSVITVLIISQHGNDPACWQANVVCTLELGDVQESHVDPSSVPPMKMQIFVMWHLKLLCSGPASTSDSCLASCVLLKTKATTGWEGQSERLDGGLGFHQPTHSSQLSESTTKAARQCVFPPLPSLANTSLCSSRQTNAFCLSCLNAFCF